MIEVSRNGSVVTVERLKDGKLIKRHPDDIKLQVAKFAKNTKEVDKENEKMKWQQNFEEYNDTYADYDDDERWDSNFNDGGNQIQESQLSNPEEQSMPRRSNRTQCPNRKYFNENMDNS